MTCQKSFWTIQKPQTIMSREIDAALFFRRTLIIELLYLKYKVQDLKVVPFVLPNMLISIPLYSAGH